MLEFSVDSEQPTDPQDPTQSTVSDGAAQPSTPAERPKRRRAASRPAGPPKEVAAAGATIPVTQAAGQASGVASQGEATDQAAGQSAPEKPKRRRATRKAAAPEPLPEPTAVPQTIPAFQAPAEPEPSDVAAEPQHQGTSPAETDQAESAELSEATAPLVADAQATAESQSEPAAKPARSRRTRSRKTASAAEAPATADPSADAPVEVQPAEVRSAELPEPDDSPAESAQAPEGEPAPKRRRTRKSAKAAESADGSAPQAEPTSDVDAALAAVTAAAAERPRRGRKVAKSVANPFVSPQLPVDENGEVDAQAVLNSLAASIAAGDRHPELSPVPAVPAIEGVPEAEQLAVDPEDAEQAEDQDEEFDVQEQARDEQSGAEEDEADQDEQSDDSEDSSEAQQDDEEGGSRRRRRRRGGRRRRRGSDSQNDDESGDDAQSKNDADKSDTEEGDSEDSTDDDQDKAESDEQGSESGRRRRRRRRRRGEDTGGAEDDPSDVVVRVREPRRIRSAAQANDEVTGIDGSTRMEAKKQRRREGRAAGRRRAPILSESEFLARRESVNRRMVIRQNEEYTQLAVLEDNILVEHYVDRASATSLIGNIYLGRVQNVLPSMEAAFIDIGRGRNAVLYAGEIDWDAFGAAGEHKKVEQVLKSGQTVLVQVSKDPVGAKGARLTSHISLPGRYVVYSPGGHLSGISRKLADSERHRLKDILGELIDDKSSVIVRTAAEGASEEELVRDVNRLKAQWEIIEKKSKQGSAPQQLYAEPDLTVRIVRDLFTEDFQELVVAGNGGPEDAYEAINGYVTHVAPHLAERLTKWDTESQGDLFAKHKIDEQISKALERKVFLPSGGSLVIDRTEAMTVIDVNTGKFTGTGGNLEATVTSNNLEAAEEVVRQLRLRDIGGIIVIDFIDMVLPSNRELLLRRLVECLGRDRTRHQVAEVTSLGLVQMTRKKIGTGLAEAFTEECSGCGGRGFIRHDHPVESQAPADGGERHGGRRGRRNNH
ncbi:MULTISPECIES: Rne/Rng family ribonuclease [unclassified Luteococcus]|uniref:Rne/Rng family ribonuclease n=1 Tax=unclassified Luteococcus TaxID=2639923 RepID=UPI00313B6C58